MFRQPMFLHGKPQLLRYITRNQKRTSKEDKSPSQTQGLEKEERKEKGGGLMSRIIQEVSRIQEQQLGLESMLADISHKNEEKDFSTQVMMSRFYNK
ncbi:MAG: hypothetical protein P4M11_02080 [Candidatus Pacebacteria bacterium]|nr:hypothetical protein [Candidatus Paceibacterota bacterium]